jgi:hypothetical protein
LVQRNIQTFHEPAAGGLSAPVAMNGQKLHLFQMIWRMDKIPRRDVNRGNKRLFGLSYH